jgi:hypothetical protein
MHVGVHVVAHGVHIPAIDEDIVYTVHLLCYAQHYLTAGYVPNLLSQSSARRCVKGVGQGVNWLLEIGSDNMVSEGLNHQRSVEPSG